MTVKETAAFLRQHDNYLILTHKRPDGDTIGCAAALCEGLRALGRTAWICPHTEETHLFTPYLEGRLAPEGYVPETVVSVDIAARSLFTRAGEPWLARGVDLAIDHHPSQAFFAAQTCLDAGRAACGELIYDILAALGSITPEMALPLYVALSTDSMNFWLSVQQYHSGHPPGGRRPDGHRHRRVPPQQAPLPHQELGAAPGGAAAHRADAPL